jgi:hypothetical protein
MKRKQNHHFYRVNLWSQSSRSNITWYGSYHAGNHTPQKLKRCRKQRWSSSKWLCSNLFGNQVRCSCRISLDLEARRLLHASKIQRFLAIHLASFNWK